VQTADEDTINRNAHAGGCSTLALAAATWLNRRRSAEMYTRGPSVDSLGTQLSSVDEFPSNDGLLGTDFMRLESDQSFRVADDTDIGRWPAACAPSFEPENPPACGNDPDSLAG
jgi:hypothetical protein